MRTRSLLIIALFGGLVAIDSTDLLAQRPDGSGGGRPQMDPEALWNRMSGGADSVDLNKNLQAKMMVQMGGGKMPADGILTKTMFQTAMAQRIASRGQGGPGGYTPPGGGIPAPVPGSGVPMVVSVGSGSGGGDKPIVVGAPGSTTPSAGGGFPGGGGGFGYMDPEAMFKRTDRNGDGKISREEASQRLQPVFDQYDSNKDGAIDASEYKTYFAAATGGQGGGSAGGFPSGGGGYPGGGGGYPGGGGSDPKIEDPEIERPVVYRFGKLPKDFPYASIDKDEDGQVSLYEWRTATKAVDEFLDRDLNGDGFLTAEEWLRGTKSSLGDAKDKGKGSYTAGGGYPGQGGSSQFGNMGGRSGGGGFPGGKKDDKKDDKKDERKGRN